MIISRLLRTPVIGIGILMGIAGCTFRSRVWNEPYYVRQADKNHNRAIDNEEAAGIVKEKFDLNQDGNIDNHEAAVAIENLTGDEDFFDSTRSVIGKALAKQLEDQHKNQPVPPSKQF